MPQRTVVPKHDILLVVAVCINVLGRDRRSHDSAHSLAGRSTKITAAPRERSLLVHEGSDFFQIVNDLFFAFWAALEVQLNSALSMHLQ